MSDPSRRSHRLVNASQKIRLPGGSRTEPRLGRGHGKGIKDQPQEAAATIGANKKQHQNGKHAWADREYLHVGPDCWFADAKK